MKPPTRDELLLTTLDELCRRRWETGIRVHRKRPDDGFHGDALCELAMEIADGVNYAKEFSEHCKREGSALLIAEVEANLRYSWKLLMEAMCLERRV